MSEEEKFLKAQDEWFANLSYDEFELHRIDELYLPIWEYGPVELAVSYNFYIKVEKGIDHETIQVKHNSTDVINIDAPAYAFPIKANRDLSITADFYKDSIPDGTHPQDIPITVSYTTTDGENFSQNYVLDFAQTPFYDFRTGTGLYNS